MKKLNLLIALLSSLILISACESEPSEDLQDSIVEATPETNGSVNPTALFDPSNSVIPFPNNLLFSGTLDLTLNIPVDDPADTTNPRVAINTLDGFSTNAPMTAGFSTSIDPATISGTSVKLYEVTLFASQTQPIAGPVIGVTKALQFGTEYVAALSSVDTTNSTLAILPTQPLMPLTSYMVVITDDLKTASGEAFAPSVTYRLIKSLSDPLVFGDPTIPGALQSLSEADLASFEGLRQIITTSEATVAASDAEIETSDIIQSWSFTTQSIGNVLTVVRSLVPATPPAVTLVASTVNLGAGVGKSPAGAANMFEGTIDVPYYLTAPTTGDPTAFLTKPWQAANAFAGENNLTNANPLPAKTGTETIPLLVSTPVDTGSFPPPWKTVIFQAAVQQARDDILAVADSLASAGLAVVAIDLPLHGIEPGKPYFQEGKERTFGVDFLTQVGENVTGTTPDGTTDTTGIHYANLANLQVLRDNLRQSIADLFALTAAIPTMDVDGGGADLDGTNIFYVGHSLGSIIGTTFLALEPNVQDAVLGMSGVGLAKIFDGSTVFSPILVNGLAPAGISKGTADYEAFVGGIQTVIDSADPVNYATTAATGRGILLFEIVGGNSSPSDLFVPNTVPDANDLTTGTGPTAAAPLAGTEPMVKLMGLTQVNTSQPVGAEDLKLVLKFTAGDHRSFLTDNADLLEDPDFASAEVTGNIRTGMATFLGSAGMGLTITDASIIQAPSP